MSWAGDGGDPTRHVVRLVSVGSVSHRGPFAAWSGRRLHRLVAATRVVRVLAERPTEWTVTLGGRRRRRGVRDLCRLLDGVGYDLIERTTGRGPDLSPEARRDLERQIRGPVKAKRLRYVRCRFVRRTVEAGPPKA